MRSPLRTQSRPTSVTSGPLRSASSIWFIGCAVLLMTIIRALAAEPDPATGPLDAGKKTRREIYVPFEDLNLLLEGQTERIFLTRSQYEELLSKAGPVRETIPPLVAAILSADYQVTIVEERALFSAELVAEVVREGLHALPLQLKGVGLLSAAVEDQPVPMARDANGQWHLLLDGKGRRVVKLELVAPLATTAAQQSLTFQVPTPSAARIRVTVPGNVEVKSGASVLRREVDAEAQLTHLELLPQQGEMALRLSLNNRLLRRQQVVVARSVLVAEVTSGYERLHASVSLDVLHGAVDRFRFLVPEGFEVTEASSPDVSRWLVRAEEQGQVLEVVMRQPIDADVLLTVAASRTTPRTDAWSFPRLQPLDMASQLAVVGLLVEDQFEVETVTPRNLIGISTEVLTAALPESVFRAEPGAPSVRPVAAFYAPHADFDIEAIFRRPAASFDVRTNMLLTLSNQQHRLRGRFSLQPRIDKLFRFDFEVPPGWNVTQIQLADGTVLPAERFPAEQGSTRIQVRLPAGVAPGNRVEAIFDAEATPPGWLDGWTEQQVPFPRFQVLDAHQTTGALAVQPTDDLAIRPGQLAGLTPLNENEKPDFGLEGVVSQWAYRFESLNYQADFQIVRNQPWLTAQSYAFFQIAPNNLVAHYELAFDIQRAASDQLTFSLPESTPAALSIRALDGVRLKEFNSQVVDGQRHWTVLLVERRVGLLRLAVDFRQRVVEDEPKQMPLPPIVAEGVSFQTALVAVEGSAELDIEVSSTGRRVDVGELYNADYQVGRRLLGAFAFLSSKFDVKVDVFRRPGYLLPPAIVQRAELITLVSPGGRSQTAARFQLRTKAPYLELHLPPGTLWSVYLDGKGIAPQREGEKILISLPASAADQVRNLQVVYEAQDGSQHLNRLDVAGPKLFLRTEAGETDREVPLADLVWHLYLPAGLTVTQTGGTVSAEGRPSRPLPIVKVIAAVGQFSRGLNRQASQVRLPAPYYLEDSVRFNVYPPGVKAPQSSPMAEMNETMDAAPGMGGGMPGRDGFRPPGGGASVPTTRGLAQTRAPEQPAAPIVMDPGQPAVPPAALAPPSDAPQGEPQSGGGQAAAPQVTGQADRMLDGQSNVLQLWALQGIRSLDIHLTTDLAGREHTFRSLGVDPRLTARFVDDRRIRLPAWGVAAVVLLIGVVMTGRPILAKARYVLLVGFVALVLPLVTPWQALLGPACDAAFIAACLLIPYYFLAGLVWWSWRAVRRAGRRLVAATILAATVIVGGVGGGGVDQARAQVMAAEPAVPMTNVRMTNVDDLVEGWLSILRPHQPLQIPDDAIVIPYDASAGLEGVKTAEKLLVPYQHYIQLWNLAHPDQKREPPPPRSYAISSGSMSARLEGDELLVLHGRLVLDVFVDQPVTIPLPLRGGALAAARLDGQPARLRVIEPAPGQPPQDPNTPAQQQAFQQAQPQQAQPSARPMGGPVPGEGLLVLQSTGKGRKQLEFTVRFRLERRGGWRVVEGQLPLAAATSLELLVPQAQTDVRLTGVPDRQRYETTEDGQTLRTTLVDGNFSMSWRPRVAEGQVDQNLTARSNAVLEVQEDGLRLRWTVQLEFRRDRRESFTLSIPSGYLVERVEGANVRGWQAEPREQRQMLEVTLLKPALERESIMVELSQRLAEGKGEQTFVAPVVEVPDAVLHQGQLLVRRSPLLELQTAATSGVSRTDASGEELPPAREESPLGLRDFQAFRFVATPFSVELRATPLAVNLAARWQTILRIGPREMQVESRVHLTAPVRPIYQLELSVPDELQLDEVVAPGNSEWSQRRQDGRRRVTVLLKNGLMGEFALLLRGRITRGEGQHTVALPSLEVVGLAQQRGDVAIQVDPAFEVQPQQLQGCRTVLPGQVYGWLNEGQRALTQLALRHDTTPFSGQLAVVRRQPRVSSFSVTNVRVTERTIEETILLEFTVREAGIRELRFLLPAWMRDARIEVPLLRQKTLEPVVDFGGPLPHDEMLAVRLELQDELMGQVRVLIQNDRLLSDQVQEAPLVIVQTGVTEQRFVTLESAGRDEVVVNQSRGLEEMGREQKDWRKLVELLGDKLTRAYLVRNDAPQPSLTYQTKTRLAVDTPTARIGLGTTLLVVDQHGAYRGEQVYQVENTTEQFLEIELPEGASLWTVHVAGEPVKPTLVPGATSDRLVRLPIIKTDLGDDDYPVQLKYGGRLTELGTTSAVTFPLIRTRNINVELSQVRLRLSDDYRWFNFGGSMRRVQSQQDLQAGYLEYKTRQIQKLNEALSGSNPFTRARVSNNLKQLGVALHSYRDMGLSGGTRAEYYLQQKASESLAALEQAEARLLVEQEREAAMQALDNRSRLNTLWQQQRNDRATNVVTEYGANFDRAGLVDATKTADTTQFNRRWLDQNELQNPMDAKELAGGKRIQSQSEAKAAAAVTAESKPSVQLLDKSQQESTFEYEESRQRRDGLDSYARNQTGQALERYKSQLEVQQQQQQQLQSQQRGELPSLQGQVGDVGGAVNGEVDRDQPVGGGRFSGPVVAANGPGVLPMQPSADAAGQNGIMAGELDGEAYLASLSVQLAERGMEFNFTTRDEIEITAQTASSDLMQRGIRLLAVVFVAMMLGLALRWLGRRR